MSMKRYVISYEYRGTECVDANSKGEAIDKFYDSFVVHDPFGDLTIAEIEEEYDED